MSIAPQVSPDSTTPAPDVVPLTVYSAALDEIFLLRRAMAYEADVVRAHAEYKTFPKSRRPFVDEQVERLRGAARGDVRKSYADRQSWSLRSSLLASGASETMTRSQWESQTFGDAS